MVKEVKGLYSISGFDHVGQNTTVISDLYYVDTSAPETGNIIIADNFFDQLFSSSNDLMIHLKDFKDRESGIDHFEIGVGSSKYLDDIVPAAEYHYNDVEVHIPEDYITEGHYYFVVVTVSILACQSVTSLSYGFEELVIGTGQ